MTEPTWDQTPVPNEPVRSGGSALIVGALVLGACAAALWWTEHPRRAAVLLGVGGALLLTTARSPKVRALVTVAAERIGHAVGLVLGVVLLLPAYYLIVTPLGWLLRAIGGRLLDLGRDPGRPSYWTARTPAADPRPARLYTDQRRWEPVGSSRRDRRRAIVGAVVATLLVQAAIGGGWLVVQRREDSAGLPPTGVASVAAPRAAAVRDLPWAEDAYKDQFGATQGLVFTPFTDASIRDFTSETFNVANRVRASYVTPLAEEQEPIDVWFFGGSTMFGFDLQRDEHTIPSEVVRLAEADGIAIRARNYGMAGYVNYQETVLLSLLVTGGPPPDLVVFYDGTNDWASTLVSSVGALNPVGEPGTLGARQMRQALAQAALAPEATGDPPSPLGVHERGDEPLSVERFVDDTIAVYQQGIDLSQVLAAAHEFEVVHFWQPDLLSKQPLDPGELALLDGLHLDEHRLELMRALLGRLRDALPDGVHDISDALDEVDGPVLSDIVHVNERGGRAVAEAMYEHLGPELARLRGSDPSDRG